MSNQLEQELKSLLDPLYRYAMALTSADSDARDLVQETMLRAVRNERRFLNMEFKRAWLLKVLTNIHRDGIRRKRRYPSVNLMNHEPATTGSPDSNMLGQEQRNAILRHFHSLPNVQRQVMYLRCVEEFSIQQIAHTLGTTNNNVKANLSIARTKVRDQLKRSDDEVVKP